MKLQLAALACIGTSLYCAEKVNPAKIIREALATRKSLDRATMDKLRQQHAEFLKEEDLNFIKRTIESHIAAKQPVPARIIAIADTETAAFARQHNQSFIQTQQPK
jgi:hypothetical protein